VEIHPISQQNSQINNNRPGGSVKDKSFKDTINSFLTDVNNLLNDSEKQVHDMAEGKVDNIHDVMIAAEKANIGLELVVEIRNKLLEAYQEMMRMQV